MAHQKQLLTKLSVPLLTKMQIVDVYILSAVHHFRFFSRSRGHTPWDQRLEQLTAKIADKVPLPGTAAKGVASGGSREGTSSPDFTLPRSLRGLGTSSCSWVVSEVPLPSSRPEPAVHCASSKTSKLQSLITYALVPTVVSTPGILAGFSLSDASEPEDEA